MVIRDVAAVIMAAVGGPRPAVILARDDQVDLVAALAAHLRFPQPPVRREREAEQVAMAHRPEWLRRRSRWPSGGHGGGPCRDCRSDPAPESFSADRPTTGRANPSGAKAMRCEKWPSPVTLGCCRQITLKSSMRGAAWPRIEASHSRAPRRSCRSARLRHSSGRRAGCRRNPDGRRRRRARPGRRPHGSERR